MPKMIFVGLATALVSGLLTGIQATLFTVIGRVIGPARASLVLNVIGTSWPGSSYSAPLGFRGGSNGVFRALH